MKRDQCHEEICSFTPVTLLTSLDGPMWRRLFGNLGVVMSEQAVSLKKIALMSFQSLLHCYYSSSSLVCSTFSKQDDVDGVDTLLHACNGDKTESPKRA